MRGPLSPQSQPIDKDSRGRHRGMRVRACDGPYRGHFFRFYPEAIPGDPFGGPYATTHPLADASGKVTTYVLTPSSDPRKWEFSTRRQEDG